MPDETVALVTTLDARITAFEQQMSKAVRGAYGAADRIEKAFAASNDNIARKMTGRTGFASAINSGLGEVRSGVESTAASVPILGSALGALGPVGIGVAAVLGGVAIAMNKAAEAAQFSDDLSAAASRLSVTAEALQELRYAAEANDIEVPKAEAAIMDLNAALGALQSGVGDGKIRKALEALKIPQDQIDSFRTAEDLLPTLSDHIVQLSTEAQQVQLAKKFGVVDLLPLLRQGSEGIATLRRRAHELNLVLDEETVQSTANLNEELRVADERLSAATRRLNTSFVPALVSVKTALADAAVSLAGFFNWIGKDGGDEQKVQQKVTQIAKAYERASSARTGYWGAVQAGASGLEAFNPAARERIARQAEEDAARLQSELKVIVDRQNKGWEEVFKPKAPAKSTGLGGGGGGGGGKAKPTAEATDTESYEDLYAKIAGDSYKLFVERFKKQVIAASPDNADGGAKSLKGPDDFVPSEEAITAALAPLVEAKALLANQIEGGLRAGFEGGAPAVLDYFASQLKQRIARSLANDLADLLQGASTKGGVLGSLASFAGSLIGHNAMGDDSWRGGPTWVGEHGPELLNLPGGSKIVPNDILRSAANAKVAQGAAAFSRSEFHMTLNLEGANGDETIRRIAYDAAAQGFAAARMAAKGDLARKVRNTIP